MCGALLMAVFPSGLYIPMGLVPQVKAGSFYEGRDITS